MAPRIEDSEPNHGQIEHEQAAAATNRHFNEKKEQVQMPVVWRNVVIFIMLHLGALYGIYSCFYAKWQTNLFGKFFRFRFFLFLLSLISAPTNIKD